MSALELSILRDSVKPWSLFVTEVSTSIFGVNHANQIFQRRPGTLNSPEKEEEGAAPSFVLYALS